MIINNLSNTHYKTIDSLLEESDELFVASPFLSDDMGALLGGYEHIQKIRKFTLITTLKNKSDDLIKKSISLPTLVDFLDANKVSWKVHINNQLHGKVYLFKKSESIISGIVSSANLTDSGMNRNHEWGLRIEDQTLLQKLQDELVSTIQKHELGIEDILMLMDKVEEYLQNHDYQKPKVSIDINRILSVNISSSDHHDRRIFIKPIGVSSDPIPESATFSNDIDNLHFSKRRPTAVREGDVLVCYGVGTSKLLSYYRVVSDIKKEEDNTRWPYYVIGKNQSKAFGQIWSQFDFHINHLAQEFKDTNPSIPLTFAGGFTLGALNYGQDKIRLTPEFGQFLIQKISENNN